MNVILEPGEIEIITKSIERKVVSILKTFNERVEKFESKGKSFEEALKRNSVGVRSGSIGRDEIFNLDMDSYNIGQCLENLLSVLGETKDNGRSEVSKMALRRATKENERLHKWLKSFIAGVKAWDYTKVKEHKQARFFDGLVE